MPPECRCAGVFPTCRCFLHVFGTQANWESYLVCPVLPTETYRHEGDDLLLVYGLKAGKDTVQEALPFLVRWLKGLRDVENARKHWEGEMDYRHFQQVKVAQVCWADPWEVTYR